MATAVAVLLAAGVVTAFAAGEGGVGRSADARLAAAQAHARAVTSYRYEGVLTDTVGLPEEDGPGTSSTSRMHLAVDVAGPGRWHATSDTGEWTNESLRLDDRTWQRFADGRDDVTGELWVEGAAEDWEMDADDLEAMAEEVEGMGVGSLIGALRFGGDPADTVALIAGASDPVVVEEADDGGATLRVTPPAVPGLAALDVAIELELDLDGADEPAALRIVASADDSRADLTITFTGWDVPVELAPPAEDTIDHTPWVDEDAVLAHRASTAYGLGALPEGYELVGLGAWEADDEWGECAQVVLEYGRVPTEPPADERAMEAMWDAVYEQRVSVTSEDPGCEREADVLDGLDGDQVMVASGGFGPTGFGDGEQRVLDLADARVLVDVGERAPAIDDVVALLVQVDVAALLGPFNDRQAQLAELGLGAGAFFPL
jgi:hypothetical protein